MGWRSVVAIVNDDNGFKGVELRKQDGSFEILWTRSNEDADVNWRGFAAECGLSVEPTALEEADSDRMVVTGFNTEGTIFHRTTVPAVGDKEIESIIRLQAETRLPLPSEQTTPSRSRSKGRGVRCGCSLKLIEAAFKMSKAPAVRA